MACLALRVIEDVCMPKDVLMQMENREQPWQYVGEGFGSGRVMWKLWKGRLRKRACLTSASTRTKLYNDMYPAGTLDSPHSTTGGSGKL